MWGAAVRKDLNVQDLHLNGAGPFFCYILKHFTLSSGAFWEDNRNLPKTKYAE